MAGPGESILVAEGDLIEVRLFTKLQNQVAINVLHYGVGTLIAATDLGDIAVAADTQFNLGIKALISNVARYEGVMVQRIRPGPVSQPAWELSSAGIGGAAGDPLPKQVAGIVRKQTDLAGRSYRGRNFFPFPAESHNDTNSTPTVGYMGFLDAMATAIAASLPVPNPGGTQGTLLPVIFSRKLGTFRSITATVAIDRWATQRRRGDYGRENMLPF